MDKRLNEAGERWDDDYGLDPKHLDSLDRLLGILRGQISLARAVNVRKVAVDIDDLERLLNILQGDQRSAT